MKKGVKSNTAMNNLQLNISVEDEAWIQALPDAEQISNEVMNQTLRFIKANEEIDFLSLGKPIIINLALSNDTYIQELNAEFRKMNKPTNVLSFANIDDESFEDDLPLFNEIELGDIMIAIETMQREALEKGISLKDHYSHLFIHGLLHLLGYDHQEDAEAELMEGCETQILASLNIKNPYQE